MKNSDHTPHQGDPNLQGPEENVERSSEKLESRPEKGNNILATVAMICVAGLLVATLFNIGYILYIKSDTGDGEKLLDTNTVKVVPVNNIVQDYDGQLLESADPDSKMLASYKDDDSPAGIRFGNSTGEYTEDAKDVDMFVDFSSVRSNDMISLNAPMMESYIKNGELTVNISNAPTGDTFTLMALEALALATEEDSSRVWKYMVSITSNAMSADTEDYDSSLEFLSSQGAKFGYTSITPENISRGRYGSWLVSSINDARIPHKVNPPVVITEDNFYSPETVNFNDPDDMSSILR